VLIEIENMRNLFLWKITMWPEKCPGSIVVKIRLHGKIGQIDACEG